MNVLKMMPIAKMYDVMISLRYKNVALIMRNEFGFKEGLLHANTDRAF